jgi:hypothetical protein
MIVVASNATQARIGSSLFFTSGMNTYWRMNTASVMCQRRHRSKRSTAR